MAVVVLGLGGVGGLAVLLSWCLALGGVGGDLGLVAVAVVVAPEISAWL